MRSLLNDLEQGSRIEADVLIVGGGIVGLALGNQLADAGRDVVILESGTEEPDEATQKLYEGRFTLAGPTTERPQDGYLSASRFRYFGGSGNQWGGVSLPLDPADFEARDWVPNSGWPLTLEQLKGIGGEHPVFQEGGLVLSIPDAIAYVFESRYLQGDHVSVDWLGSELRSPVHHPRRAGRCQRQVPRPS